MGTSGCRSVTEATRVWTGRVDPKRSGNAMHFALRLGTRYDSVTVYRAIGRRADAPGAARLQNLASKLAHTFKGAAVVSASSSLLQPGVSEAAACVYVVDGIDLALPLKLFRSGNGVKHIVATLGAPPKVVAAAFPGAAIIDLRAMEAHMIAAFQALERAVHGASLAGVAVAVCSFRLLRSADLGNDCPRRA